MGVETDNKEGFKDIVSQGKKRKVHTVKQNIWKGSEKNIGKGGKKNTGKSGSEGKNKDGRSGGKAKKGQK